jgi:hypothetical protein
MASVHLFRSHCTACPHMPHPQVREGLYYNPYFPGGAIAMPKMLVDGGGWLHMQGIQALPVPDKTGGRSIC